MLSLFFVASSSLLAADVPTEMQEIGITDKTGSSVDIDHIFLTSQEGKRVPLSTYFNKNKPVILSLVYYGCPNICGFLLNGMVNSLRTLKWSIGEEFEVVTVSIHPGEGYKLANEKKVNYVKKYGRLTSADGWHFLTGEESELQKLAKQVGFGYRYDKETEEYAHASAIFVLTPEGRVSRTLYGIDFPNRDLKLSLLEASEGRIGTVLEQVLMYCFKYDPLSRGYSFYALRLVQAGGLITILFIGLFIFYFTRQRRSQTNGSL